MPLNSSIYKYADFIVIGILTLCYRRKIDLENAKYLYTLS